MILCVLRDLADPGRQQKIDTFIRQEGNELKGTSDQYRLSLRERDRRFFEGQVQVKGSSQSMLNKEQGSLSDTQKRIASNVKRIHNTLSPLREEERWSLATFIVQQCYLVVVTASDRDSAYRIFSVMNDRGLDLSPTDILKAETIGGLQEADEILYGSRWESVEERLGRDDFRDLFAHIRMIQLKTKMRRTLQADFSQHVLRYTAGPDFIAETLEPYADIYEILRLGSYDTQDAEDVRKYLALLGRLDNFDWIPPAMLFFRQHLGKSRLLLRFSRDLERLAYGLFIRRANVNQRIKRYAQVITAIERGEDLFMARSPLQLSDEEKEDVVNRLGGEVYTWVAIARRVFLLRLDTLVAEPGPGVVYDHKRITVEHVLPQSPKPESQWMTAFPDEEERQYWTHRLANLVILSRRKNSRASNWEFDRKKEEYFQHGGVSPFALTTQVISESDWTPRVLERRQSSLVRSMTEEWRLD